MTRVLQFPTSKARRWAERPSPAQRGLLEALLEHEDTGLPPIYYRPTVQALLRRGWIREVFTIDHRGARARTYTALKIREAGKEALRR